MANRPRFVPAPQRRPRKPHPRKDQRMAEFEARVDLAAPREEVFAYLTNPDNVAKLTAPEAGLKLVKSPNPFTAGSFIHLELSGFGPTQAMVYEITDLTAPEGFTEVQAKGPLKSFRQEHVLTEAPGGTTLVEKVRFEPPGGMLGFLVTEDRVRKGLLAGYRYRHEKLVQKFGQL